MGEEALISAYFAPLAAGFDGAHGLLDDCASLRASPGHDLVMTVDAVRAGVHFFADDAAFDIAWKALAVNVSDLVAKGARPRCYLMALAFAELPEPDWLAGFAAGLRAAQTQFGIVLAGGDTDRQRGCAMSVTITAIGEVPQGRMVLRRGARPGDIVFVTGEFGASAVGLRLRQEPGRASALGLGSDDVAFLLGRYLRPEPPVAVIAAIRAYASASMDISDGLVKDARRLAAASGVCIDLRAGDVPVPECLRHIATSRAEVVECVLAGGDDYQLLAAVAASEAQSFRAAALAAGVSVTAIGEVTTGEGLVMRDDAGRPMQFQREGYDHFG